MNGYIKFEERVKRRRLERQLDAARAAIEKRQPNQAAPALDEAIELNPDEPELSTLVAALDNLRRPTSRTTPRSLAGCRGNFRRDDARGIADGRPIGAVLESGCLRDARLPLSFPRLLG